MVEVEKRATTHPMAGLRGVKNPEAEAIETRELDAEEMDWLLAATKKAPTRFDMEPEERVLLYRFAFESGIRPGQIRALTCSCFDLDEDAPHVTSRAMTVKRRKVHRQALRPKTAELLREAFDNRVPEALAFPTMPDKYTLAEMFRADLADARAVWLKTAEGDVEEQLRRQKSDFLATVDHEGRRAIFYSLRHSHWTALRAAGVPQKDIQASLHTRAARPRTATLRATWRRRHAR